MTTLGLGGRVGPEEMGEKGLFRGRELCKHRLGKYSLLQGWESGGLAGAQQACKEALDSELEGLLKPGKALLVGVKEKGCALKGPEQRGVVTSHGL